MSEEIKEMSIEEAFKALDLILEELDGKDGSLEDSFARYQQGLSLVKFLNGKIDGIEKKLQILEQEAGENNA